MRVTKPLQLRTLPSLSMKRRNYMLIAPLDTEVYFAAHGKNWEHACAVWINVTPSRRAAVHIAGAAATAARLNRFQHAGHQTRRACAPDTWGREQCMPRCRPFMLRPQPRRFPVCAVVTRLCHEDDSARPSVRVRSPSFTSWCRHVSRESRSRRGMPDVTCSELNSPTDRRAPTA